MAKHRGLYKRGNIWWLCYKGLNGEFVRKSSGSSKFADAEYKRSIEVKNAKEKKEPEKEIVDYTFEQLAEKYINYVTGLQASAKIKTYVINAAFLPKFKDKLLKTFNRETSEQLQKDLLNIGLVEGGIDKYISIFKAMFTYAGEHDLVSEAVVKKVHKVKMFNPEGRDRYLSYSEMESLISVCPSHLQPLVITALHTGMRKGEILKLVWSQVDLEHGFFILSASENKKTKASGTKTKKKREIPIDSVLRALLQSAPRHFTGQGDSRELVPYVFHDPKTFKPYGDVKTAFHTALKIARIEDCHFHDLRHTFASHYMMNEGTLVDLKDILGHANIKQTMRYAHFSKAHKLKSVSIMDKMPGAVRMPVLDESAAEGLSENSTSQLLHNAGVQKEKELAYTS